MGKRTWMLVLTVTAALVVVGVVAVALLWPRATSSTSAASASPSAVDPSKVSPTDLPTAPEVEEPAGAIKDASFGACATDAGDQAVAGTITNSTQAAADYVITVSWVNESSDVLARGVKTIKQLEPGAQQEFKVAATVPDGVTTCTFHVLRGRLSG